MIGRYKEIETKNGIKYHFYDKEDILICTVLEDGKIINNTRAFTDEEKEIIREITGARI